MPPFGFGAPPAELRSSPELTVAAIAAGMPADRRGRQHRPRRLQRPSLPDRALGEGAGAGRAQLVSAAETELVVVLVFFAAAVTGDQMDPRGT